MSTGSCSHEKRSSTSAAPSQSDRPSRGRPRPSGPSGGISGKRRKDGEGCPIGSGSGVVCCWPERPASTLGNEMPTKKYLCIQRSPRRTGEPPSPPSPAQMQEMFASFNAWKDKYKDNIVDMGGKLMPGGKILSA